MDLQLADAVRGVVARRAGGDVQKVPRRVLYSLYAYMTKSEDATLGAVDGGFAGRTAFDGGTMTRNSPNAHQPGASWSRGTWRCLSNVPDADSERGSVARSAAPASIRAAVVSNTHSLGGWQSVRVKRTARGQAAEDIGHAYDRPMAPRVLTARHLNRALLDRQLLLERSTLPIAEAIEQVGGLQTQYAPSGYVGLWTRLADFRRAALTEALEERGVIQATLVRTTIHMVSRREFWLYAMGVREPRRRWALRIPATPATAAGRGGEAAMLEAAQRMREALSDGPRSVKELGELGAGFVGNLGLWVDLVRVPPSGTWERRRADILGLAETWVGPSDATEGEGLTHVVRAYLRAFGPAAWRDIAAWAGISIEEAKVGGANLALTTYHDDAGRPLFDLEGATLPEPDRPAPVRFLPHWDANLLVHARRAGILPEAFRSRVFHVRMPFSVGVYLVGGVGAGAWSLRDGRIVLDPFRDLTAAEARAVEREREALEAFHA